MWRPLLYMSDFPDFPSTHWTQTGFIIMTSELLDQLSAVQARISELRGYL